MPRIPHSDLYIMDKGYDSEEIHELIQDTLKSCSLIPVSNRKRKRILGITEEELLVHSIRKNTTREKKGRDRVLRLKKKVRGIPRSSEIPTPDQGDQD